MVKVIKKGEDLNAKKVTEGVKHIQQAKKHSEEEQASTLAHASNLPYIDLNIFPISADDLRSISESEARENKVAIFQKNGKEVRIAVTNPSDPASLGYIEKIKSEKGWDPHMYVVSKSSMEKVWEKYASAPLMENLEAMKISLSGSDLEDFEKKFKELIELKDRIRDIPTTKVVSIIMAGAINMGASDIHFEPQEQAARLRFRIDGALQEIGDLPTDAYKFILSRIKMMAKMKVNVRDIAQDGHFSVDMEKGKINVRANIIPGNYGESIVMRLLDQATVMLSVEDLGLKGLAYKTVQKQIEKPHGMILTVGPTGSGKTTTLYAFVNKLNNSDTKIITVEDPIEYEIKGISQTQIEKDRGYTFGNGLRAIVRQDPDVILVGEIRDEETIDIAINAALTGHLVLSTFHTNSAPATIPRIIELGVKPNLIAPSINAFIAQRLVRKLCSCKEAYTPAKETIESIKKILSIISPKAEVEIPKNIEFLYRPKGCAKCHDIGYKGRIGIFEVMTITPEIEKLIMDMGGEREMAQAAIEGGMITMAQDGILKAVEGITSMEEVWGTTGQTEFLEEIYESLMEQSLSRAVVVTKDDMQKISENISSLEKFAELVKGSNQKDIARYVFGASLLLGVGDIHIEPEAANVKIRFRIDGILETAATIPLEEYPSFLGEIKMLSGFKSDVRGGVRDSRFAIAIEEPFGKVTELKTDVRVSIITGGYGETVVLRILSKSSVALDLEKLGIRQENLERINRAVKKPNGVFLTTGPTGSGKTTTLYSILRILNNPEVKIITVEDPIEYQLEGILQTPVSEKDGYTFATALRALLRQNPDIMMIGEIRDDETANIAVQAALTGHSILSTLHTNNAAASINRLLNMGVSSDDLATSVNAIMAQRLVRRLCDCKEMQMVTQKEKQRIENVVSSISPKAGVQIPKIESIFRPKGCEKCNMIGYKGRMTVSEVLLMDREIEELIARRTLASEIQDKAIENGMITMAQDAMLRALEGHTSLDEVDRVIGE